VADGCGTPLAAVFLVSDSASLCLVCWLLQATPVSARIPETKIAATREVERLSINASISQHKWSCFCYLFQFKHNKTSGAVESAIKQIDLRLKLTGTQWKSTNVNQILQLRCAYLNGQLAV
jgi:hypothetical protein